MKKLLSIILALIVIVSLSGCNSPAQDTLLEDRLIVLENKVLELELENNDLEGRTLFVESYLDRMVWSGYLLPEQTNDNVDLYASGYTFVNLSYIETLSDKERDLIDVSKFPAYIWDEAGDYISLNEVLNLLTNKYLERSSSTTGTFQLKIKMASMGDFSTEEYMVRLSMLLMELAEYDFYTIDYPAIQFELETGASKLMYVKSSILTTPKYEAELQPAIFWNLMFDSYIQGFGYSKIDLDTIHTNINSSGLYVGYVLPNFK